MRLGATRCETIRRVASRRDLACGKENRVIPKVVGVYAAVCDVVRNNATNRESSGGGARTPDTRMMIQSATAKFPEKHAHCQARAAPGAADETGIPIDADLQAIIER